MAEVLMNTAFEYENIPRFHMDAFQRYYMEAQNMMADLCNDHLED